jgi:hypothetical protein
MSCREDSTMSQEMMDAFVRQCVAQLLAMAPLEKRLEGLSPAQRLAGLSAEEIAQALSPDARESLLQQAEEQGPDREVAGGGPPSAAEALLRLAQEDHRQAGKQRSALMFGIMMKYCEEPEGTDMSKEFLDAQLSECSENLLGWLSPAERLMGLSAHQRLQGLPVEEVVRAHSPKVLESLVRQAEANVASAKAP